MNGNIPADKNNITPITVCILSLSIIPFIKNNIPKNPKIPGKICEKINDPVNGIVYSLKFEYIF